MKFTYEHNNVNVMDLDDSLKFYNDALNLKECRRIEAEDGSFIITYLKPQGGSNLVELTWLRDWDKPYNLGDNEFHMAFRVDDFDAAFKLHQEMDVVVFENQDMGIYFIADPDGYWIEILPTK
ncbi:lactoylglutathione lyase [Bacilli bacterium PM5-3]|nr:lactoylglutathione lyase [Bacilli bacterium PM5-3]MDH6603832.1 lactoylglutathione lyase [Bacilli bacterium PM5-9]